MDPTLDAAMAATIIATGGAVTIATEVIKSVLLRAGVKDTYTAVWVFFVAALFVGAYAFTRPALPVREDIWTYLLTWLIVGAQAAGLHGLATVTRRGR